jgi:PKD repeat protein
LTVTPGRVAPPNAAVTIRTAVADRVAGKPITFDDASEATKPLTTPVFTFPTGQVSPPAGQRSVQYIFANPGTFDVTMQVCWVEDPKNCGVTTVSVTIVAAVERPVAAFSVSGDGVIADPPPARLVTGRPATFTSTSTGEGISAYNWSVAGQPQPNQPAITVPGFDRPGRVSVTLTVSNAAGQSTPVTREFEVVDAKITPSFTASSPVTRGQPTRFTDTSEGYVTRWEWDFGDNSTFSTNNPTEKSPDHTYQAAGTYTVKLRVTNAFNADATVSHSVVVNDPVKPTPVIDAIDLQNGTPLGGSVLNVLTGVQVQFSDTSTANPATSWVWHWGDGTPDTEGQRATHTFTQPGRYEVRLVATNAGGSSETTTVVLVGLNFGN